MSPVPMLDFAGQSEPTARGNLSFMPDSAHSIRDEIRGVLSFVGVIWLVYFLTWIFPALGHMGLVPRTLTGLVGIVTMPFLHANLEHLLANTVPLIVLLTLLAGSRAESWEVVLMIGLGGGLLLWVFGRSAEHVGASGLVSGLIAFLILSGFLEHRIIPLLTSILVAFLYGGSLILGILPRFNSHVSWDGHLASAIAGSFVAYVLTYDSNHPSRDVPGVSDKERLAV